MRLQRFPASVSLALLIGAVHTYLLVLAWIYIGVYSPLPHWLTSTGFTGGSYQSLLFPADFVTNMVLCVPAAYLLCKLRPCRLWLYLAAAILPSFLWQYSQVIGDSTLLREWPLFLPGALHMLLPLPATALIIRRFLGGAPNNSFKGMPLRGTP